MTIIVTGSAGHLGEALMRRLRQQSRQAVGLDVKGSPFTDHVGSIGDRDFVRRHIAGATALIHAATLHKPHVGTHTNQDFIDTNVTGTLMLLEEAVAAGIRSVVFTSTTSTFGSALTPAADAPAAWITEDVRSIPRNIYGVTKVMAESLCELFFRQQCLPVVILRTSRFFPEADDNAEIREGYEVANVQANELLYRRVDIEDVVSAHLLALEKAPFLGFRRYIISATTPFVPGDLSELRRDAVSVVQRYFADYAALYAARNWSMFPRIDRVYVNDRARSELGWQPKHDFRYMLDCLRQGRDFRSNLAREVGSKGYHDGAFADGLYPVS